MKNIISLLCLLVGCTFSSAQVQRFIYEYRYSPVADKKDSVLTDLMALDLDANGSKFENLARMERDSAMRAIVTKSVQTGNRDINFRPLGAPKGPQWFVTKDYMDNKTYLHERLFSDQYKIVEDEKITWKILPDTQTITGYKAQKATTTFGGRQWTAWFAADLPLPDGPYKFNGLPGLIVKIDDASQTHGFTLVASKKISAPTEQDAELKNGNTITRFAFNRKEIPVTEQQFQKVYKNYLADPAAKMRETVSASPGGGGFISSVTVMTGPDGKKMDRNDMIRNMEKHAKKIASTKWNRLEWGLYEPLK